MDVGPLTPSRNYPGLAQRYQVLRKGSLPRTGHGLELANAGLAIADGRQNLQAGFLPDRLEHRSSLFGSRYIHHGEYIITTFYRARSEKCHPIRGGLSQNLMA
jgi:hypothetical protein